MQHNVVLVSILCSLRVYLLAICHLTVGPECTGLPSPDPITSALGPQPYAAHAAYTPYVVPVKHNMVPGQPTADPVQHIMASRQQNAASVQ